MQGVTPSITSSGNYSENFAFKYSRLRRAMCDTEIPFGHSSSQARVLVQLPNPSSSIFLTMARARFEASTLPWGRSARELTRAATNSIAEPFLQVATQAPQPMHAAASILSSAVSWPMRILFASWADPVRTEMNPPACRTLSNALRSTTRSFITGKAELRQGSTVIVAPSLK